MNPTTAELKKQDIVDQLIWDDSLDASDVKVSVHNDEAELTGTVSTYAAKKAAEKDAYMAGGIKKVKNNLTVEFPEGIAAPTDTDVTSNIETKLKWDSQLNDAGIKVETQNGIVSLSGVVDSYWEKSLAENISYNTNGVIDVINHLTVAVTKSVVDIDIENDIKSAFKRSNLIDEKQIVVSVIDGIVYLTGKVSNYVTKRQAYNIAVYTTGVIDVADDITVFHSA